MSRCWLPDLVALAVLFCRVARMPRARGMTTALVRDGYGTFRQPKLECGCCEMLFLKFVVRLNFYVFSLNRNADQDDRIFDCLLTSWLPYWLKMRVPLSCL